MNEQQSPDSPAGINWEEVKQRLDRVEQSLVDAEEVLPEQAKQIMDARARQLARVPQQAPDTSEIMEVMTFALAGEWFALETHLVREATRPSDITPLPGGPKFLVGVMNLRGEVTAVMDLARFFNLQNEANDEQPQVLVLGIERVEFAIQVDSVDQVTQLRISDVLEPPGSIAGVSLDYLRGVTAEAMLVLDGNALLNDARLYIDDTE